MEILNFKSRLSKSIAEYFIAKALKKKLNRDIVVKIDKLSLDATKDKVGADRIKVMIDGSIEIEKEDFERLIFR